MAAMERVLELRENYDIGQPEVVDATGKYSALNITVCNMSLGGPTLYAGRDLEDQLTQAFLDKDIVLVISANAGPGGATGGAAAGFGALTVGASSSPVHERILRSIQFGLVIGARTGRSMPRRWSISARAVRRPTGESIRTSSQTASALRTGPGCGATDQPRERDQLQRADRVGRGRRSPAEQLTASARQVRNALMMSANPGALADGSGPPRPGRGATSRCGRRRAALAPAWTAPDTAGAEGGTNRNVNVNILQGAGVETFSDVVTRSVAGLKPGQRFETFYKVTPNTAAVVVTVSGVTPGSPQNALFGDDILLTVHSAKTSSIGEGDYKVFGFTTGGSFTIPNPELGLMRITLNGDWTNASPIGATVTISPVRFSTRSRRRRVMSRMATSRLQVYGSGGARQAGCPSGMERRLGELPHQRSGSRAPLPPSGPVNVAGATLNSPEIASITNPVAGEWTAVVVGFTHRPPAETAFPCASRWTAMS